MAYKTYSASWILNLYRDIIMATEELLFKLLYFLLD